MRVSTYRNVREKKGTNWVKASSHKKFISMSVLNFCFCSFKIHGDMILEGPFLFVPS